MPSGQMRDTAFPVLPGYCGAAVLWEAVADGEPRLGTRLNPPSRPRPPSSPGRCGISAGRCAAGTVPSRVCPFFTALIERKELLRIGEEGEGDADGGRHRGLPGVPRTGPFSLICLLKIPTLWKGAVKGSPPPSLRSFASTWGSVLLPPPPPRPVPAPRLSPPP